MTAAALQASEFEKTEYLEQQLPADVLARVAHAVLCAHLYSCTSKASKTEYLEQQLPADVLARVAHAVLCAHLRHWLI
jgi:hypothetical protein